jgi:hypothetical protein
MKRRWIGGRRAGRAIARSMAPEASALILAIGGVCGAARAVTNGNFDRRTRDNVSDCAGRAAHWLGKLAR